MSKILIVEDDPLIQKTVVSKLKQEGFDIISCDNGKDGLERLKDELPDILLTDVMLPYVSGLELVSAAKAITQKSIRIIVCSSFGQENNVEQAFALGADDYITKPFRLGELVLRIKKQLQDAK